MELVVGTLIFIFIYVQLRSFRLGANEALTVAVIIVGLALLILLTIIGAIIHGLLAIPWPLYVLVPLGALGFWILRRFFTPHLPWQ